MVRIATVQDAEQLEFLNNEFNGEGETTLDNIRSSLAIQKVAHNFDGKKPFMQKNTLLCKNWYIFIICDII